MFSWPEPEVRYRIRTGSQLTCVTMKLAIVCLLACSIFGAVVCFRTGSTAEKSDSLTENGNQLFDNLLNIIKIMLCNNTNNNTEKDSDDLFQMILDLAKIFLCADKDSDPK